MNENQTTDLEMGSDHIFADLGLDDAEELYFNEIRGRVKMRYPLCIFMNSNPGYQAEPGYNYEKVYELLCEL